MFKIICVTNRAMTADFMRQMEKIAQARPDMVIVREKDLPEAEYGALASQALRICRENGVKCVFHTFVAAAKEQNADGIHLSLPGLRALCAAERECLPEIGCSVHSAQEAVEAQGLGAAYVVAGHIFQTDSKKGVPARGTELLERICAAVSVPVYAIGGIDASNARQCAKAGAAGVCMMSGFMRSESPQTPVRAIRGQGLFVQGENGRDISARELEQLGANNFTIVDIRGSVPFSLGNIAGSVNLPFPQEAARLYEIPRGKPVIVCCQKGEVSCEVAELLVDAGYEAYNLKHGYLGWLLKRAGG